jgi:DNA-binding NtrC family response regulator
VNNSVLVVDDEVLMREVLVRWLRAAGYSTSDAYDATTALELIGASEPGVVLVDIEMPGRDGLWLVERIREQFPSVAIVLATARDTVPAAVSMQDGVVDYLVKPFELDRVVAAVKRALDWHETAVARRAGGTPIPVALNDWLRGGRPPVKRQL